MNNRKLGSIALARQLCYEIAGATSEDDDISGRDYGSVDVAEILSAEVVRLQAALAQPKQEPSQWRDMVVVSLVREGVNKHKARELADHFATPPQQQADKFCDANCVWTDHHPDCNLAQPEQEPVAWDKPSVSFNEWWDGDRRRDNANPFTTDSFAYWAWEGWQAALAQPEQEPVCPDCKAAVLYECVACSSNNYPPQMQAEPPPLEWLLIKNIIAEYGLDAIAFVAEWKAAQQQAEPVAMRMPKVGDRIVCLEDESLGEVVSLTAGGSPDITFDDGSHGTYLLREFFELFGYVNSHQQQAEPIAWLYPEGLEALQNGKCWTAYPTKHEDCNIPLYIA